MTKHPGNNLFYPMGNAKGGAAVLLIVLVLILAAAGGGGYWAYNKYLKPKPIKTKLASQKVKEEVVQFTNDYVSPTLYNNLITIDDAVAIMDKELKRLGRIGTKFPDQKEIITTEVDILTKSRKKLFAALTQTTAALEKMYVIWLVDPKRAIAEIKKQRAGLSQRLADTFKTEAPLIGRIRSNPKAAS